jgi:hypothetical protein
VGTYVATFSVTDGEGNESCDNATVTVGYRPPSISLAHPSDAGLYVFGLRILRFLPFDRINIFGSITLKVAAHQYPLGIERVEIVIDDRLVAISTEEPYMFTWGRTKGFLEQHIIKIYAYGTDGQVSSRRIEVYK